MSYILDALKKSDQQRQQNNGPTLQTVQHSQVLQPSAGAFNWLIAIIVLLLVTLLALAGWYYVTGQAKNSSVSAAATTVAVAPSSTANQPVLPPAVDTPPTVAAQVAPVNSQAAAPAQVVPAVPAATAKREPVVEMWQLPDTVQQQLPAMTFSFHVYSDNPQRRTIIINNRRVKQGDTVAQGLLLEEITPLGVVLQWQQLHRFSINVVENW
jgi:general secretion pathway protein B